MREFERNIAKKLSFPALVIKIRNIIDIMVFFRFKKFLDQQEKKLSELKNKHIGQRCFIIGTGPSLNKTNLDLLKGEILIGVNTLFNIFDKHDIICKYWSVSDGVVFKKHHKKLLGLDTTLFLSETAASEFLNHKKYYLKESKEKPFVLRINGPMDIWNKIGKDITKGVYGGATVTIQSLQVAFYLGFKEVYLLGCDCDYSGIHRFDGSKTDNLRGMAAGETKKVFSAYKICKKIFEDNNRKIYNATVGGKLEVFKRKSLEDILL